MTAELVSPHGQEEDGIGRGDVSVVPSGVAFGWTNEPLVIHRGGAVIDYESAVPNARALTTRWSHRFINTKAQRPTEHIRSVLVDFLSPRDYWRGRDMGYLILGISELANNALQPRAEENPTEVFATGSCDVWLCDSGDPDDHTGYVLLGSALSPDEIEKTRKNLAHLDPVAALNALNPKNKEEERGRGVLIAAACFQEDGVAAQILTTPLSNNQQYMAIMLKIPL